MQMAVQSCTHDKNTLHYSHFYRNEVLEDSKK
ncbi:hypothetical protein C5S36_00180 [Candidatus Methanophagaceae archaeon]|nr:hypothetical protein C5S36_00180 [Methanophagales archaeon]